MLDFIQDVPIPFILCGVGTLLCVIAHFKIQQDLESQDALPAAKWWQRNSLSHQAAVMEAHRSLYPLSRWRYVYTAGFVAGLVGIVILWINAAQHPRPSRTTNFSS